MDQSERLDALNATIGNLNSLQSNISKENHQELYKKLPKNAIFFFKRILSTGSVIELTCFFLSVCPSVCLMSIVHSPNNFVRPLICHEIT